MSPSALSNSTEAITNVVFGIFATAIGAVTVWQGHKVWKMWREHAHGQENVAHADVELGLQPRQSTPTSLETPGNEEVVAAPAPPTDQIGEIAESEDMPASVQDLELQSTLPTPADVEASLSPALVQGPQLEDDDSPRVHTEDTQLALTDIERCELRPAANDDL